MDPNGPLDRLLPRHSLSDQRVQIGWDIRPARRLRRRAEHVEVATVLDLSLDGALVEVAATSLHEPGSSVTLRFGGVDGTALIRHRQDDPDGDPDVVRYGIQWVGSSELRLVVEKAVAVVRGHNAELRSRWEGTQR